jgi:hypothetical protein
VTSREVPAQEPASRPAGGSNRMVLIALAINALIAAAKAAAGVLSGPAR